MNHLEEKLWNYIDGQCSPLEKLEMEALIARDLEVNALYQDLLMVNKALAEEEIDEPSMSFTRNVMESVAAEIKPVALKTKVDQRIVKGIAGFFIIPILAIWGYALFNSSASVEFTWPSFDVNWQFSKYLNSKTLSIFLMVDVVLLLVYMDLAIRRKKNGIIKKGE